MLRFEIDLSSPRLQVLFSREFSGFLFFSLRERLLPFVDELGSVRLFSFSPLRGHVLKQRRSLSEK